MVDMDSRGTYFQGLSNVLSCDCVGVASKCRSRSKASVELDQTGSRRDSLTVRQRKRRDPARFQAGICASASAFIPGKITTAQTLTLFLSTAAPDVKRAAPKFRLLLVYRSQRFAGSRSNSVLITAMIHVIFSKRAFMASPPLILIQGCL